MENEQPHTCRIFIVDDHPAVCEGLALLLEPHGILVCGDAKDSEQALKKLESMRPDVVLVDLSLEFESGIPLIEQLHVLGMRVLVYSMHEDAVHIRRAFSAGANGYITKRDGARALIVAIREVVKGGRYLSERSRNSLIEGISEEVDIADSQQAKLSDRERVVLQRMGKGDSSTEIAEKLHISPRTVETYYSRIIDKLQLGNTKELRRYAIQQGREGLDSGETGVKNE